MLLSQFAVLKKTPSKTQHREEIEVLDDVFSERVKEKIREVK